MQTLAIRTDRLSRSFRRQRAVSNLSLRVPGGSIYGFLGPNGAGKTTTIRLLLGQLRSQGGSIQLLGRDLNGSPHLHMSGIGAMVEQASSYPHLTARENLEIIRRMRGLDHGSIHRALTTVRLTENADRPVKGFSLGMRQRLSLAEALIGDPELLILDEPSNGLDPAGIREMRNLIGRLPEQRGITVFLSSHLLPEIEHVATHLGVIKQGELVFQGTVAELESAVPGNNLEDRYLTLTSKGELQ